MKKPGLIYKIFVLAGALIFAMDSSWGQIQTYTSNNTFTVPAGVTSITVKCWGAGGGGSTRSTAGQGGGGGGGAYASSVVSVTPGNNYNIVVGTGGSANSAGGSSSFNATTVVAAGGGGGTNDAVTAGTGGTVAASTGTTRYAGGNGANGGANYSGGGGGGAGDTGAGGDAPAADANNGAAGTGTASNGGNGGTGINSNSSGNPGNNYGGGGGGARRTVGGTKTGGSGAGGYVVITWTQPVFYSQSSGDPGVLTNWNTNPSGGGYSPSSFTANYQTFIIQSSHTMSTTGTFTISGTNTILEIAGTLNENNAITFTGATLQVDNGGRLNHNVNSTSIFGGTESFGSTSTINYGFAGAQTVVTGTYGNLILSGSGAKTTTGVTVNGILSMEGTATASAAPGYGANATLQYNTATARTTGVEWITPFNSIGGVIISGTGTITLNAAKTVNSGISLTINSGATLDVSTNNYALNLGGNFSNNGTFTQRTGTVTFNGTSAQTIGGSAATAFNDLTISNSTSSVSLNTSISVGGTLTLSSGTLSVGANTLTLNGPAIAGTPTNLSTTSSSSLIFGGSSTGVLIPSSVANLNNLTINNTNGITLTGSVTLGNILTMTQGNITTGSNTLILSSSISGNLSYTTGTIIGKFQRAIGLPTGTQYLFPVGTAANYNPLKITFSNLTAGQLAVQFQPNDIGTSGLPLNDAGTEIFDRQTTGYWTLTAIAPLASTNYNVNLNYSGFTGVDALARILKRTNGGNLSLDGTHGTVSSPEITRNGLNGISTTTTDFAIGRPVPRFTTQPLNYTGCNATFSVTVSGKAPLTYQWQENNGTGFSNITNGGIYSGATTNSLAITGALMSMNGFLYRCIVTDALGYSSTSNSAALSITQVTFGYNYSSDITLDPASGSTDLTDFPALISIINSPDRDRLRTIANGGHVFSSNGYDIVFTDQSGNKLDHQIEFYDAATGQYVAWVRIPLLSRSASTTIKMMYGNPTVSTNPSVRSVWTSNYKGVWHLNGTDYSDATIYANNGTENATSNVAGRIAGGRGFNGTTSYITVPTSGFVPNNNNQTISIWANYSATPGGNRNLITFQNAGASSAIQLGFRGGNAVAWKWGGAILVDGGAAPSINTWHYYVYTYDGTTSRIFIDGVEKNNSTVAPQTAMPTEGNIGRYNNGEYLAASLDEPRFSMSPKSAGWILTEYNNQNDPASFILISAENATTELASVGVCSTSFLLDQGFPSGGTYSGPGVSGTNFNASVAGIGTHQITYLYSDAYGCTFSVNKDIIVTPVPAAPSASNKECCISNIADLEASGTNLKWFTDPGLTVLAGTGTPFATGKTAAGVYTYYVTQTINGCESTATAVSLTIFNGITITSQPLPVTICEGNNTFFSITASGYNLTYQWQENGGNISNGGIYSGATTTTLTLTNPGIAKNGKLYRCVVSTSCGTSPVNSTAALLTVTAQPVATFSYVGTPYCLNSVNPLPTFSGGGVAGTFSSTSGLVFVSTSTGEVNIATSTPGNYIVTNTISPSGGCGEVIATSPISIISDVVWTGAGGSNWNDAGNWSCGSIPNQLMSAQIPDVTNKPVLSGGATASVNSLVINNGSSLTITGNSIRIYGTITNNGTFDAIGGTIEFTGTAAQLIGANVFTANTIKNLTLNNSAGLTLQGPLNVTGIVNIQNGTFSSGGYLTLVSSATETALIDGSGSGTITGNVTMQRYLPSGFGYKYIGSPFQASTVNELGDEINLSSSFPLIYRYNENRTSSGWVSYVKPDSVLKTMAGYSANFGSSSVPVTADITGVVNNGNLSIILYNHNRTYTQGFNLVGNPYPSPIDWDAPSGWTKTNIGNALYYFKASLTDQYGGTYSTYINGVSSDGLATGIIPSMQGFFVHVNNGAFPVIGTLAVNNSVRVTDLTHPFLKSSKAKSSQLLRLSATFTDDVNSVDPMVVYFDEKASGEMDNQFDALKLMNTDLKVPNIYSVLSDGSKLSINGLPLLTDSTLQVPLGLKVNRAGTITIKLPYIEETTASMGISLFDAALDISQDLLNGKEYVVTLNQAEYLNRFYLNLGSVVTDIHAVENDKYLVNIYSTGGILKAEIVKLPEKEGILTIFNLVGQPLFKDRINGPGFYEFSPGLKDGLYIVTIISGNHRFSRKVYIKG